MCKFLINTGDKGTVCLLFVSKANLHKLKEKSIYAFFFLPFGLVRKTNIPLCKFLIKAEHKETRCFPFVSNGNLCKLNEKQYQRLFLSPLD